MGIGRFGERAVRCTKLSIVWFGRLTGPGNGHGVVHRRIHCTWSSLTSRVNAGLLSNCLVSSVYFVDHKRVVLIFTLVELIVLGQELQSYRRPEYGGDTDSWRQYERQLHNFNLVNRN